MQHLAANPFELVDDPRKAPLVYEIEVGALRKLGNCGLETIHFEHFTIVPNIISLVKLLTSQSQ
jgi:hypothetical protein